MCKPLLLLIVVSHLALVGCGGSDSLAGGPTARVVAQETSLRVTLKLDGPVREDSLLSSFPPSASSFILEIIDPVTNASLAGPVSLDRVAGQSTLAHAFDGLPRREVRLLVRALDASGSQLGLADQAVRLEGPEAEVTVSTLLIPGPTREIGRLSIGQQEANGPSSQPAISSDGRFVAFTSSATNLLGAFQSAGRVYRKDRVTGVVTMLSVIETGFSTGLDAHPDISGDGAVVTYQRSGEKVFFNDLASGKGSQAVTPLKIPLGTGSLEITSGREPKISEDGSAVVFVARPGDQIALYDRGLDRGFMISQATVGEVTGTCSHPVVTKKGREVFFATGPSVHGPGGLVVVNRSTGERTRLPILSKFDFPCAVSGDGRIVVVHDPFDRLLLFNRDLGTTLEIPRANAFAAVGAPSISADGRFVTFCSSRADLVSNDQNSQTDLFVFDRSTAQISRLNVSNDQTAVAGGLASTAGAGPVISRDGSRIAFASEDPLLVPLDNNLVSDVFSAVNPTQGKLYVATDSAILRYDKITTASGIQTPTATLTGPALGSLTSQLYLDVSNDRLYVITGQGPSNPDTLLIFDKVSTLSGKVTPTRQRIESGLLPISGLFVDVGRDQLYCGAIRTDSASKLGTEGRTNLLFGANNPGAITVDTRQRVLYSTFGGQALITVRSQALNFLFDPFLTPGVPRGLALDVSPAGVANTNTANLLVLSDVGFGAGIPGHSLVRFAGNGGNGSSPSLQQLITGTNTLLGPPPPAAGPLLVDSFSGTVYAANGDRISTFPVTGEGNLAPTRDIQLGVQIRSMALDRSR